MWMWLFFLGACGDSGSFDAVFPDIYGNPLNPAKKLEEGKGMILYFISPECPLCENYTVTLRNSIPEYRAKGFVPLGVVSGEYYTPAEVQDFLTKYQLDLEVIMDNEIGLANHFDASITPEVVLLDSTGRPRYRGAIDNWAISLGQKRQKITAHYLREAVRQYEAGKPVDPQLTKAVGCFIE
jgi:peroxiredoxin